METLSYGYLKPSAPDKGPEVFPALEQNFQRVNDHIHDGINSSKLSVASIDAVSQTLDPDDWVDRGGGTYRMLVSCPPGISLEVTAPSFRHPSGDILYLSMEWVAESQFYLYINEPGLAVRIIWTS